MHLAPVAVLILPALLAPQAPTSRSDAEREEVVEHAEPAPADEPEAAPPGPPLVSFDELRTSARDLLHRELRLRVQFHSEMESWNPYLTRFGAGDYHGVIAWADEQLPWVLDEYENPAVRLFVPRGSAASRALARAERHERFAARVVARELAAGQVWLEVQSLDPLGSGIPEGCVIHAARGIRLMQAGLYELSRGELARALSGPLSDHAREELLRLEQLAIGLEAQEASRPAGF